MRTLNFDDLNLSKRTLERLKTNDLTEASPLQQSVLSHICNDKSLVVNYEEGNDKFKTFSIAALEELQRRDEAGGTAVIIITDSPEAPGTICQTIQGLGVDADQCICADDTGSVEEQTEAFKKEPGVIVANPGRLQNLLQKHRFIFRGVSLVILDCGEPIGNGHHAKDLKQIKRRILSDYCTLICSEKYNESIRDLASQYADEPVVEGFEDTTKSSGPATPPPIAGHLKQGYINVPYRMKISTLMAHLDQSPKERCVIFTASKRGTDRLYRVLKKRNMKATSLHAKLSDQKRSQRFSNFTNGNVQHLLVADISASELNITNVQQVINYDVPNDSDEYRFRAALANASDSARIVSLVSKQDRSDISELQNELGQTPEELSLPKEVKEKLKQRKNKKANGRNKRKNGRAPKNKEMRLPQPSYDKLSGGRTGNHDKKKTGIVKFFKKLFS